MNFPEKREQRKKKREENKKHRKKAIKAGRFQDFLPLPVTITNRVC